MGIYYVRKNTPLKHPSKQLIFATNLDGFLGGRIMIMSEVSTERFAPFSVPSKSYKKKKVKCIGWRTILEGEAINQIIDNCNEKGFISIPYKQRGYHLYNSTKNTYLAECKKNGRIFVEVYVKENKAYACFDTISLEWQERKFNFQEWLLEKELETYYEDFEGKEKMDLFLPFEMTPYTHPYHRVHFSILPKQICFSFLLNRTEVFDFVLKKINAAHV
jgi:hypothetical protein